MADPTVAIYGDKIVALLNAATLSDTFTATRKWFPFWESIESIKGLTVTVVPNIFEEDDEGGDRDHGDEIQEIYIGVQKKLTDVDDAGNVKNSEVDPLVYLAEEIRDMFFRLRLGTTPDVVVTAAPLTILGEHIAARIFTAAITLRLNRGE